MRKELLRVSTILRYPKQKRDYVSVINSKLDYLHKTLNQVNDTIDKFQEVANIKTLNLYEEGKLTENLTSPWFWSVSKYIGEYTQTRIICHQQMTEQINPIRTFILVGAASNVYLCYMMLRWVYYAIKWGTTSKNKHYTVGVIIRKLKKFLENKRNRDRFYLSSGFRDRYLYHTHGLPKIQHNQIDEHFAMVVTINYSILPEGTFKNRKLIC